MRAQPALLRARAPYLIKNTITGAAICGLVIGICMLVEANREKYLTVNRCVHDQRRFSRRL
jgi:Ca2+/H+ antiporter